MPLWAKKRRLWAYGDFQEQGNIAQKQDSELVV